MANNEFGGVIDSNKTYTRKSLAIVLDREEEWVVDNIIHAGCPHFKMGLLLFISGKTYQLFVEARSEPWAPPARRGKQKNILGD